jgi:hypothetical protein
MRFMRVIIAFQCCGDVWILMWRTVGGAVLILNSAQLIATQLVASGSDVPLLCRAQKAGALSGDVWILSWGVL